MACCSACDNDDGAPCCEDTGSRSVLPVQQANVDEDEEPVIWGPVSAEIPSRDNKLIRQDTIQERLDQILRRGRFTAGHDDTLVGEIKETVKPDPDRVPPSDVIDPLLPDDATREDVVAMIHEQNDVNGGLVTGFVEVTPAIATVFDKLEPMIGDALPFAGGTIYLDDRVGEQTAYEVFEGELDGYSISGVSFGKQPVQYCDESGCQILQDVSDADWHTFTLAPTREDQDSAVAGDAVTMNPVATFIPIQQAQNGDGAGGVPELGAMDLLGLMSMGDPFLMEQDGVYYEVHPQRESEVEEEAGVVHGEYSVTVQPARVLKQDGELLQQPPKLERRKEAILEDNPGMSESTAYAIAQDQLNEEGQAAYTSSTPGLRNPLFGGTEEDDEEEGIAQADSPDAQDDESNVDPIETVDDMVQHLVNDEGFRPDLDDEQERERAARTIALQLAAEMVKQSSVPDNAVHIKDRSEAPEGADILEGPRGGLYYVPPGEEGDGGEATAGNGETTTDARLPDHLDPSQADAVHTLNDLGLEEGINSAHMRVADMPDGGRLFIKEEPEKDYASLEGAKMTHDFYNVMDQPVPEHALTEDGELVVEGVEGETLNEATSDIDRDSYLDAVATSILAGNMDLHGGNFMVQDDGTVVPVDLDNGAHPLTGNPMSPEEEIPGNIGIAALVAQEAGLDVEKEDIVNRVEEKADGLDSFAVEEELTPDGDGFNERADAIALNIALIQDGEVSLL